MGSVLAQAIHSLAALAAGRMLVVLDEADACGLDVGLRALLGDAVDAAAPEADAATLRRLDQAAERLRPFWDALQFQVIQVSLFFLVF